MSPEILILWRKCSRVPVKVNQICKSYSTLYGIILSENS